MNTSFLLPHKWKKIGWVLLGIGFISGLIVRIFEIDFDAFFKIKTVSIWSGGFMEKRDFFDIVENGFTDEIIALLIIVGGILVGFCKTKIEDEFIAQLRLSSLVWSVYVNYAILLIAVLFVFDLAFLDIMIFNMFTVLLFFITRFHIQLHKANRF